MQGRINHLFRTIAPDLERSLEKGHSFFLLGPRQAGKTTLISRLLEGRTDTLTIPLQDPLERQKYEKAPGLLIPFIRSSRKKIIFIDEVQKVPELLDAVQLLVDEKVASFILSGSSARKLRKVGANMLPGRVKVYHLDPLGWSELGWSVENRILELAIAGQGVASDYTLEASMAFGTLPGMVMQTDPVDRKDFLQAYGTTYLEEEIRAEAISRKIGAFSEFLELAAVESGTSPNLSKLSMESGVSVPTIREYYRVLEDTLIAERVDPYLKNARKRILTFPRYYFFDMGVRNSLAKLPFDLETVSAQKGVLFEHAVMLEIIRRIRAKRERYRVCFWRTSGGAEVDCIVDLGTRVIPIEIKAAKRVRLGDLKGLTNFLAEYKKVARHGYVITMGDFPEALSENITVLPWKYL